MVKQEVRLMNITSCNIQPLTHYYWCWYCCYYCY